MSKFFSPIFIFVFLIISCSEDNETVSPDPDPEKNIEKYEIVDINFKGNTAIREEFSEKRPNLIYENKTSVSQNVMINPENIFESSIFVPSDTNNYQIVNLNHPIQVPLQIDDDKISLGEKKWEYSSQKIILPTKLNFKESIVIKPNKQLSATLSIIYVKLNVEYNLQLKNIQTKEFKNIKGIWIGTYPIKTESSTTFTDL